MVPEINYAFTKDYLFYHQSLTLNTAPYLCYHITLYIHSPLHYNHVFASFPFPLDDQQLETHDILIASTGARTEYLINIWWDWINVCNKAPWLCDYQGPRWLGGHYLSPSNRPCGWVKKEAKSSCPGPRGYYGWGRHLVAWVTELPFAVKRCVYMSSRQWLYLLWISKQYLHFHAHCRILHNNQDLETT